MRNLSEALDLVVRTRLDQVPQRHAHTTCSTRQRMLDISSRRSTTPDETSTEEPHCDSLLILTRSAEQSKRARRDKKSSNKYGSPIALKSKILAAVPDPNSSSCIFTAGSASSVYQLDITVSSPPPESEITVIVGSGLIMNRMESSRRFTAARLPR